MAVYPSSMAPIGVKLWENAFQTIPDISFFNTQKLCWPSRLSKCRRRSFFQESFFLEELGIVECHWQIPRQKSSPVSRLFSLYDPWRRGKSGTDRFCS